MKLLDLFCGAGGCSVGYARAGFEVVGVDVEPQPNYPYEFIQADALNVGEDWWPLAEGQQEHREFDAIHASPPCQAYSAVTPEQSNHPDLVAETRRLLRGTALPYIIENVPGAPLEDPTTLCGSSFGLGVRRHRLFETNFTVMGPPCAHGQMPAKYEVYEHGRWYKSPFAKVYGLGGGKAMEHWGEAMGISWMTPKEMALAIPPAYCEHIGGYLRAHIEYQKAVSSSLT